ncbi:hypothetical protein SK128_001120 [Halocaridina rubra]|uniref:Cadherin domain-containing protein n=1 Tax=Halocaridina rubra TaxID=373956 RepID=A0AAN8XFK1_HALRR
MEATDPDKVDAQGLAYKVTGGGEGGGGSGGPEEGEGGERGGPSSKSIEKYFTITSTGELIQLRPLDRDPPKGKESWLLKVQIRDGQFLKTAFERTRRRHPRVSEGPGIFSTVRKNFLLGHQKIDYADNTNSEHNLQPIDSSKVTQQDTISTKKYHKHMVKLDLKRSVPGKRNEKRIISTELRNFCLNSIRTSKMSVASNVNCDKIIHIRHAKKNIALSLFHPIRMQRTKQTARMMLKNKSNKEITSRYKTEIPTRNTQNASLPVGNIRDTASNFRYLRESKRTGKSDIISLCGFQKPKIRLFPRKKYHRKFSEGNCLSFWETKGYILKDGLTFKNLTHSLPAPDMYFNCSKRCSDLLQRAQNLHAYAFCKDPVMSPQSRLDKKFIDPFCSYRNGALMKIQTNGTSPEEIISRNERALSNRYRRRRRRLQKGGIGSKSHRISKVSKFEVNKIFSTDHRYVKKFMAEDGMCIDYTMSSVTSYTDQQGIPEFLRKVAVRTSDPEGVHVAEVLVKVLVKDINDNPPVFPNETIFAEVQENGPIGKFLSLVFF